MELEQLLNDAKKDAAENERTLDHWRTQHDNLKLEDVESVTTFMIGVSLLTCNPVTTTTTTKGMQSRMPMLQVSSQIRISRPKARPVLARPPMSSTSTALRSCPSSERGSSSRMPSCSTVTRFLLSRVRTSAQRLLQEKLKNSKPDLSVLKDYRKREEEFLKRAQDLEAVTKERDAKKQEYDRLTKQRLDEFMAGFGTISLKLKEMYQVPR